MEMSLRTAQYDKDPAILNFWQQVLDRVRALPGVEAAALGTGVPLTDSHSRTDITHRRHGAAQAGEFSASGYSQSSAPAYVSALGIPLLRGREFTDADNENCSAGGDDQCREWRGDFFPSKIPSASASCSAIHRTSALRNGSPLWGWSATRNSTALRIPRAWKFTFPSGSQPPAT